MRTSDYNEATIAAIATPPGPGGIGIIRISGSEALFVLLQLFKPHSFHQEMTSHKMYYGSIVNPQNHAVVDEVLVVYMRAPATYTREDVVEIHCHGSYLVLQEVLSLVAGTGKARLADPGEFTKRAFLNGRIDLTQAEAVAELLQAKTREGLGMAIAQLQGRLYERVEELRDNLLAVRAIVEVAIDFPEDDVDILDPDELSERIRQGVEEPLVELIDSSKQGKIFREGISVVILGRPNVGKSSLLNSLLDEDRAIVTAVPGTTRDTIEEFLDINGMPVRIIDTAGIREAQEAVEEIGIQRSKRKLEEADLVLLLVDASGALAEEDTLLYEAAADKTLIVVLNKIDIARDAAVAEAQEKFTGTTVVPISAMRHEGINTLKTAIFEAVTGGTAHWDPGHGCVPNVRHVASLQQALVATEKVLEGLSRDLSADLLAIDLQTVLDHLGDIVGETTTEDVLEMIFERFCIGK